MILRRDEYEALYNICKGKFSGGNSKVIEILEKQGLVRFREGKVIETIKGVEVLKSVEYTRWFLELRGLEW